jgi:hypothetical protein
MRATNSWPETLTNHIERCTFPQWDGIDGTVKIEFLTNNDLIITLTKPIPDPSGGSFIPHLFLKRASAMVSPKASPSNQ